MTDWYSLIGFVGVFFYLSSYALLNMNRIDGNGNNYKAMNLVAAVCVAISLLEHFNAPSMVIQVVWIVISIFGICKSLWVKKVSSA